jgi:hypothetical protein
MARHGDMPGQPPIPNPQRRIANPRTRRLVVQPEQQDVGVRNAELPQTALKQPRHQPPRAVIRLNRDHQPLTLRRSQVPDRHPHLRMPVGAPVEVIDTMLVVRRLDGRRRDAERAADPQPAHPQPRPPEHPSLMKVLNPIHLISRATQ